MAGELVVVATPEDRSQMTAFINRRFIITKINHDVFSLFDGDQGLGGAATVGAARGVTGAPSEVQPGAWEGRRSILHPSTPQHSS